MGMRWCYNMQVTRNDEMVSGDEMGRLITELREISEDADVFCSDGSSSGGTTWYSQEEDMRELSKRHPDLLFEIHEDGTGNADDDLRYIYYKNGKMQVCEVEINYPPYDESKLE